MKKVELKVIEGQIFVQGKNQEFLTDYKDQLLNLVGQQEQGMTLADMHKINKVFDKLEEAKCPGFMLLEDAEFELVKARCENPKFVVFSKDLMIMCDEIIASPEHLANIKEKASG